MDASRARFITVNQLAEMLAVSPLTVRRMAASEALPAYRVGRVLRFDPADVEAYLARNRSGGKADAYLKPGGLPTESVTVRRDGAVKQSTRNAKATTQGKGRGQASRPPRPRRPRAP